MSRRAVGLTWSTLRQAVEMLTVCSCMERRSRTRSRRWRSSNACRHASGTCLSSWLASSRQRSLHLFTGLLLGNAAMIVPFTNTHITRSDTVKHAEDTVANLCDADSLSIKSRRVRLTSALSVFSESQMLSRVIKSSNDNIVPLSFASWPVGPRKHTGSTPVCWSSASRSSSCANK